MSCWCESLPLPKAVTVIKNTLETNQFIGLLDFSFCTSNLNFAVSWPLALANADFNYRKQTASFNSQLRKDFSQPSCSSDPMTPWHRRPEETKTLWDFSACISTWSFIIWLNDLGLRPALSPWGWHHLTEMSHWHDVLVIPNKLD